MVIYQLLVLVPSLAVGVRRLHDIGKSGWWLLLGFIPLVGPLVLLYFAVQDSQPETNGLRANPQGRALSGGCQPRIVPDRGAPSTSCGGGTETVYLIRRGLCG